MSLPSSGRISISNVNNVFNNLGYDRLSRMYWLAPGVPTSGRIELSDFYSKSPQFPSVSAPSTSQSIITVSSSTGTFTINISDIYHTNSYPSQSLSITTSFSGPISNVYVSGSTLYFSYSLGANGSASITVFVTNKWGKQSSLGFSITLIPPAPQITVINNYNVHDTTTAGGTGSFTGTTIINYAGTLNVSVPSVVGYLTNVTASNVSPNTWTIFYTYPQNRQQLEVIVLTASNEYASSTANFFVQLNTSGDGTGPPSGGGGGGGGGGAPQLTITVTNLNLSNSTLGSNINNDTFINNYDASYSSTNAGAINGSANSFGWNFTASDFTIINEVWVVNNVVNSVTYNSVDYQFNGSITVSYVGYTTDYNITNYGNIPVPSSGFYPAPPRLRHTFNIGGGVVSILITSLSVIFTLKV